MKKTIFTSVLVAVLSLFSLASFAKGTIKGKVIDSRTNEALVGATVAIQGTTIGISSNLDGKFTLEEIPIVVP